MIWNNIIKIVKIRIKIILIIIRHICIPLWHLISGAALAHPPLHVKIPNKVLNIGMLNNVSNCSKLHINIDIFLFFSEVVFELIKICKKNISNRSIYIHTMINDII